MIIRTNVQLLMVSLLLLFSASGFAQTDETSNWPREIDIPGGTVVIYQPQPEKLDGNILRGRAAVAVEMDDREQPVFGAIWFAARLETDRDARVATLLEVDIENTRFPEQSEDKAEQLSQLLEREMPRWQLMISIDNLLATLAVVDERAAAAEDLNHQPPEIIVTNEPSVLIVIDGQPQLRDIEGSTLQRVINTPFTLLHQEAAGAWYLYAEENTWYVASQVEGPWELTNTVPAEVNSLAPDLLSGEGYESEGGEPEVGPPPAVIVATEPTELISIEGKPKLVPVEGTDLLYVENTESDLLVDIGGQKYYVLLSGRWFTSQGLNGPWSYTAGENLPTDFRNIPETSDMGTVLYSVPGTEAAKEAVLDAQMPQTAAVERSNAALTVEYDGVPTFQEVEDTNLSYAVNTATPVLRLDGRFYAVDEAVWFTANNANGPWQVATEVPAEIYTISPDSSLYYVTFVKIYKVTPEYIYVG